MGSKIDVNFERPILQKVHIKPIEFLMIFEVRGSKLGTKIDQKSIKKGGQDGKASWHRFLIDFGGFLEASWEGKWSQDRPKKASKKRWKSG